MIQKLCYCTSQNNVRNALNFYMVSYNPAYMVELKKGKLFVYFQIYLKKKRNGGKTDHDVKNETMAKLCEFFLILGVLQIISSLRQKNILRYVSLV